MENTTITSTSSSSMSSSITTSSSSLSTTPTPTIIRLLDSLFAAVQQQSTQSDERTRTFLSYWMSPYALMCMITAVIMNRVVIFASSRNQRRLPVISNVILRVLAIYTLLRGSYGLFVALKTLLPNNIIVKNINIDSNILVENTFMAMPFINPNLSSSSSSSSSASASTYILRNFHMALCLSQIMDTFISVASGCKPSMETGITLFEYSLAFQEAQFDSILSPEMITIAFIALINQFNIHLLGALQCSQYRLIPSTIVGLFTLTFYAYNLLTLNIFTLPFTIIIGYFPHFCVLTIILLSITVFILSGIVRFSFNDLAMANVWGNWNAANFSLSDDFYVALINFGEFVINISTTHSYVQETPAVMLPKNNYLIGSGYGFELHNHPDLVVQQNNNNRRSGKFMIWNRLKVLTRVFTLFLKMIRYNLKTTKTTSSITKPNLKLVDIDDVENIDETYVKLLTQTELSEIDNSNDYVPNEIDNDDDDDDYDGDDGDDDDYEQTINVDPEQDLRELITVDEFLPQSLMEYQILSYRLHNETNKRITRSNFANHYSDNMKLLDLLLHNDQIIRKPVTKGKLTDDLGVCVICHENSRQIILWPCKCLAICEKCRISLFVREFATCVCCRSKVEGYSKVYIP